MGRRTYGFWWFLVALALWPAAAQSDEGRQVPAEICRGLWLVPLEVGDAEPLGLVLDTGAARTTLDPDAIRRATGRRVRTGKRITLRDVRIGPMTIGRLRAKTHELDHLGRALGREIDGILGMDTFARLRLTLDYRTGEIRLARSDGREPSPGAVVLDDVGRGRPFVELSVGDRPLPVLIDSGSTGGLTLREPDVASWLDAPRPLGGSVRYSSVVVRENGRSAHDARLGPFVYERPVVALTEGTRLLGAEALAGLALTFDRRARRVEIVGDSSTPISLPGERGIGAVLRPREAGLEIARLFEGLGAARAGLREGDLIAAIDGVPVYERGCRGTSESFSGTSVRLTVSREGTTTEIDVGIDVIGP